MTDPIENSALDSRHIDFERELAGCFLPFVALARGLSLQDQGDGSRPYLDPVRREDGIGPHLHPTMLRALPEHANHRDGSPVILKPLRLVRLDPIDDESMTLRGQPSIERPSPHPTFNSRPVVGLARAALGRQRMIVAVLFE